MGDAKLAYPAIHKPQRLRIRTMGAAERCPKGQDTLVSIVREDGTETALDGVFGIRFEVHGRAQRCKVTLDMSLKAVDLDVVGEVVEPSASIQRVEITTNPPGCDPGRIARATVAKLAELARNPSK